MEDIEEWVITERAEEGTEKQKWQREREAKKQNLLLFLCLFLSPFLLSAFTNLSL